MRESDESNDGNGPTESKIGKHKSGSLDEQNRTLTIDGTIIN